MIAERAGHAMHTALVAKIMSDPSLYEIVTFDQLAYAGRPEALVIAERAMAKRKKQIFSATKEVRAIARERVGR